MSAWQLVKKSFFDFYNHLFLMTTVSLIWFFPVAYLLFMAIGGLLTKQLLPMIPGLLLIGPLTIAAFAVCNQALKTGQGNLLDYFRALKKYFVRGLIAYWLHALVLIVLFTDFFFFSGFGNKIVMYLSGIWLYLVVFFLMSQIYFWSLLVETDKSMWVCLKHSFLLTLDNLLFTSGIFLILVGLLIVSIATAGVMLAVTFAGFLGILANSATYNRLIKYDLRKEITSLYDTE